MIKQREKYRDYSRPSSLASSSVRGTESLIWPSIPSNSTHPSGVSTKGHLPFLIGEISMILPSSNLENKVSLGDDIFKTPFYKNIAQDSNIVNKNVSHNEILFNPINFLKLLKINKK